MSIKSLLNESLISVYRNKKLTEGQSDHPETKANCVSPEQLAKEMNGELYRKETPEKNRGKMGMKDVIYHQKHIESYLNRVEGDYDVYPLHKQEMTPTGKVSKKARKVNYNLVIGSFNKGTGFIPNKLGERMKLSPGKNIPPETAMKPSATLDVEKFKGLISELPKRIFDKNPKMEKGDKGRPQVTVNTGLPAIRGIIFDNEDGEFKHINTCPGAGACQLVCYARGGFYGMNDGKIIKLIRRLNLLWNDPSTYYKMAVDELISFASESQKPKADWDYKNVSKSKEKTGNKLVIRWNDAGDFFSQTYFDIAKAATEQLVLEGYNVQSYAYTKQAKFVNLASDNFIMNFSKGSSGKELKQVDLEKVKFSDIVPKDLFKQVFKYKGPHVMKVDNKEDGLPVFVDGGEEKLKQLVSKEYNIPLERLKYQWELPINQDEKFKYDVIVLQTGDSDIGAQRMDVHKTFLLIH